MSEILETLVIASERAACVARSCCSGSTSESLLVAEKCGGEANARFDKDFKTIADVLAQECARHEISLRYPELASNVRGEECAEIGGVCIKIEEDPEKTLELLSQLVPAAAAKAMSEATTCDVKTTLYLRSLPDLPDMSAAELGVWIDPIDATAEFIAGVKGMSDASHGLPCVTVLIGAYLKSTGEPIMGVINQPFLNNGKGRIIWGASYGDTYVWSGPNSVESSENVILMSGAEKPEIVEKFTKAGWEIKSLPGAGNKLMNVAIGTASAYIVSKGTTFRWDTCGPQAILRAQGGNILCYSTGKPLTYNDPVNTDTQQYANGGGIIAYGDPNVINNIRSVLM